MATIDQIKSGSPVILDPAQHDLDRLVMLRTMESPTPITLQGEEAETFLRWAKEHWRAEFEQDLQGLCRHVEYGDLLTTSLPLVTFREDLCARAVPRQDEEMATLMDRLRQALREWRSSGVDTVCISGCDARPKG